MKILPTLALLVLTATTHAQIVNTTQELTLQGLLTTANHGAFTAATFAADGSLLLLLDQNDGIRLLKTNATATTLLAQIHIGAPGDAPTSLALDPSGDIYITGTTTSGTLTATSAAAFPTPTSAFLAKYDANLNLLYLTFLGANLTTPTGLAATATGAFITGTTLSPNLPVTPSAIQQSPALNSSQNGFVEAFNSAGTLLYATYLTGANGNTLPTGIVADTANNTYITGSTTASGFPTSSALIPNMPNPGASTTSGFLAAINPTASAFLYSTFIPGTGLASIALDPTTNTLLLTGNINPGQFPLATVFTPLAATPYQSLIRLPLNGQSLTSSILLVPGTQSFITAGPNSTAWISGSLATPLFPGTTPPDYPAGDTFLLHLTASNLIDQTLRIGGIPTLNASTTTLTTTTSAPAISTTMAIPGSLAATTIPSLLTTQTFDLPTTPPNTLLPNSVSDILPTTCTTPQCTGSAALLTLINPTTNVPSLTLSTNDLPNLTLRNQGSATATGLALIITGYTFASNCTTTLNPSNSCTLALTGTGPGTLTLSAANTATTTFTLPATNISSNPIAHSADELDFGITTSTSPPATQTLTLTNLTTTSQTFTSALDPGPTTTYTFTETSTTCTNNGIAHTIPANTSCTLTLSLTVSTNSTNDGPITAFWKLANRDIKLTGFAQAASLNLSSTQLDFGTQYTNTPNLNFPRYLYISNNSTRSIPYTPATLPTTSPFTVTDACPTTLEPHTVCRLTITYASPSAPSDDATTLTLDNNSILITGQTLPPLTTAGSVANPNLTPSATALTFATPVVVTGLSTTPQSLTVTNSGTASFTLTTALTGDFTLATSCPTTLPAKTSCQILLTFAPSQPGRRDGILSLTAGSNFSPTYITLTGTASDLLPANNGTLSLGQTFVNQPTVSWYLIQQSIPTLTATTSNADIHAVLLPNNATIPTDIPTTAFSQSTTSACSRCYLGLQFLTPTTGPQTSTLTLTTTPAGNPYNLTITAQSLPIYGLLLTPLTQDFSTVTLNSTSAPITFTLANLLPNNTTATINSITITGDFKILPTPTCTTLPNTASCFLSITFSPAATGLRTGILTLNTSAGILTTTLTGYGITDPGIAFNPTSFDFNNINTTTQTLLITNTSTAPITLGEPTTTTSTFALINPCTTLAPAASCTLTITFIPTTSNIADSLYLPITTTLNGQTLTTTYALPLNGNYTTADSGLQILPNQINFGSTPTSTLGNTRTFTLNNLTSKQLAVSLTLPPQFPLETTCTTLAPNGTCTFSLSFLPAIAGDITGTVTATGTPTDNTSPIQSLAYLLGYGGGTGSLTLTGNLTPNAPLNFGQIASGQSTQQNLTITNTSTNTITLHRITSAPPFLSTTSCTTPLAPNATCTLTLTYAPIYELLPSSTSKLPRYDTGTLLLESDALTSPQLLNLTGYASPIISTSPASSATLATYQLSQGALTFSTTTIGNASPAQTITLTNTGTTTLHILSLQPSTDFTASTTCATITPGNTCTISAQFTPTLLTATTRTGTLHILSDATTSLNFITLLGTASPSPLTITPTTLNFGSQTLATTTTLTALITNSTASAITLPNATTTGDYTTNSCPPTLAAAASCTLTITFTPTITGTRTGTLTVTSSAITYPLTIPLTGIGLPIPITPPTFTLTVAGLTTATTTITSGSPATFNLTLTPLYGFTGPVALTCAPITAGPYATCSLLSSTLTLATTPLTSTATINTITTATQYIPIKLTFILLLATLLPKQNRKHRFTSLMLLTCICATLSACGGTTTTNLRYTPAGTYQYQVTASSTTGTPITSTVTLNLIVQ